MNFVKTKSIVFLSIVIFIFSLTQEAYYIDGTDYDAWAAAWGLLLIGWVGVFDGGAGISWLANPLLILSWGLYFFDKGKLASITSILAVVAATSFLSFDTVISSAAPTYSKITEIKLGYWLWLASTVIMAIFSTYQALTNQGRRTAPPPAA